MSSQTFVPDRSKPNPHRRPAANRQTTLRKITFVRNWETNSPLRPYSFNLESILESPERAASLSPVPVVVAHPSPVYSSEEDAEVDDAERPSLNDADDEEEDEVVPETQDQYKRRSKGGPIDFSEEDIIPDSQSVVQETPVSKRPSKQPSNARNSTQKSKTSLKKKQSPKKKTPPKQVEQSLTTRKSPRLSAKETDKSPKTPQASKRKNDPNKSLQTSQSADIRKFIQKSSNKSGKTDKKQKDVPTQDAHSSVGQLTDGLDLQEDSQDQDQESSQGEAVVGPDEDGGSMSGSGPEHGSRSRGLDSIGNTRSPGPSLFQAETETETATPRLSVGDTTRNSFRLTSVLEAPASGPVVRTKRRIPSGKRNKAPSSPKKTRQEKDPDGCPVRLWQNGLETRRVAEVIDLDVILNCFEETAWEMRHQYESMTLKKALNVFAKKTQEDLRETILTATNIDRQKKSLQRSRVRLVKAKKDLMEAQSEYLQLKNDVASLKMRASKNKE